MSAPWDLHVVIDAAGSDRHRVYPRAAGAEPHLRHVVVRAGPLAVFCLNGPAIDAIAGAWARAWVNSMHLLPRETPRPAQPHAAAGAYPAAEVVLEGRQHWDVDPPKPGQPHALITASWLTVRVHDQVALQTHARAWAQAGAVGRKLLRVPPLPFNQLLAREQRREILEQYRRDREHRRRGGRS